MTPNRCTTCGSEVDQGALSCPECATLYPGRGATRRWLGERSWRIGRWRRGSLILGLLWTAGILIGLFAVLQLIQRVGA
jgi:hypothetical protein